MNQYEPSRPIRVLYIDIEGGWGGSSRSLLYFVGHLDPNKVKPIVWHRREGPVSERLQDLGVEHRHEPRILVLFRGIAKIGKFGWQMFRNFFPCGV